MSDVIFGNASGAFVLAVLSFAFAHYLANMLRIAAQRLPFFAGRTPFLFISDVFRGDAIVASVMAVLKVVSLGNRCPNF